MIPRYADHLVGQGLSSVFLNGTTGQSTSLTADERKLILEAWMKTDAVTSRKLRVINHVGGNSINEMID
jgi:N-acetylneuraminate lyase